MLQWIIDARAEGHALRDARYASVRTEKENNRTYSRMIIDGN